MKTMVHKVLWSDKNIEARHGTRHVSSMWKGVGVYTLAEIVMQLAIDEDRRCRNRMRA